MKRKIKGYLLPDPCPACGSSMWGFDVEAEVDEHDPALSFSPSGELEVNPSWYRIRICPQCDHPTDPAPEGWEPEN